MASRVSVGCPNLRQMSDPRTPQGERFSHIYLARGEPTADSARMRHRLGTALAALGASELRRFLEAELGITAPQYKHTYGWREFTATAALRDILDTITITFRYLDGEVRRHNRTRESLFEWLRTVRRIFAEENLGYQVDVKGGVHFAIDEEFERNRSSAIASLQGSRYANALAEFTAAFASLDLVPANGKAAIRGVFLAAEALFLLMFPAASILGGPEVARHLRPVVDRTLGHDASARSAAHQILVGFKAWVIAAHNYRHEQGTEEPAQPPLSIAVLMVSQGAAFVRWLAELDQEISTAA
jgi:hypothetical protein